MNFKYLQLLHLVVITSTQIVHGAAELVQYRFVDRPVCDEDLELKSAFCIRRGLQSVPQHLPEDITGLYLRENNITSLLSSSFRRYLQMAKLDLSFNDIRSIDIRAFHPLKDLTLLNISYNDYLVLPSPGLFRWARKLSHIYLHHSFLRSIPNDIFKWSRKVDTLDLGGNRLDGINISSCGQVRHVNLLVNDLKVLTKSAFNFRCNCDDLILKGNPITSVDPNVIASLNVKLLILGYLQGLSHEELKIVMIGISRSTLETFRLIDGADLSVVPKDLFDPLRDCPLKNLDISRNQLRNLYPFVFSNLTRVRQFKLVLNKIVTLEPNYFEGMWNLRVLNVNSNMIKQVNTIRIPWSVNLNELHIGYNDLPVLTKHTFRGLHNLTYLYLASNRVLSSIETGAFVELINIETIDFSSCNIITFQIVIPTLISLFFNDMASWPALIRPRLAFREVQILQHYEMRQSGLKIENLWDAYWNVSLFDQLFNLITLDLSKNPLSASSGDEEDLPAEVFRELSALQNLSVEDCDLSDLHPGAFTGLKSLQVLILRSNKLEKLSVDLFKHLLNITMIDLGDNLLTDLDGDIFSSNRGLKTLLLSNNKFTRLDQNTFKPIYSSLALIDLSMNPINCNCDLKWLLDWLSGPLSLQEKSSKIMTICSSESLEPLRGKNLIDFDPKDLCSISIVLICFPSLAIICLIFIIALVYHNRWQLRHKLFLVKLAVIGFKEIRDARDHNDYEFDLNVIFYDDDEDWIREHLRPAVAERLPQFQRNVFGDDELVLGMHYLDSVDYVVSHSYKTVVILSRAAVRDRWFILKFRTAMDHVSDTQTEFVVVVFLEDIPDNDMPFLVRLYLSDGRPYIHWTEDIRGHEYFFEELTKHLTINLRTDDRIPIE
nr:toll-like receptor 3 [Lytechinus pictus]